jgi:hypothetical protein
VLRAIAEDARVYARWPILHIEAHGDFTGINVASGEYLPWREFEDALIAINESSRLNLVVVIAACKGAHLVKVLASQIGNRGRAPMRILIGPVRNVTTGEIEQACPVFYRTLFDTEDGGTPWHAMNDAVAPGRMTFGIFTAEDMFYRVMHGYFATHCSEDILATRENRLVDELVEMGWSGEDLERGRQALRRALHDQRPYFEQWKERFFFCDLYPENAARFDVTFEECQNASHL